MAALFGRSPEISFGASRVTGRRSSPCTIVRGGDEDALRDGVRKECTNAAGVYGMFDEDGRWIYVGKSKRLKTRLGSYFRAKTRASKERRILDRTAGMAWERTTSEFAALLRELELIQRWRPPYNVKGQPTSRSSTFLCVGSPPAPYLYLSEKPGKDAQGWYGPLPDSRRAADAARRLNDYFGLRDCPKDVELTFADQGELFPILRTAGCLRLELATCLGPCVAACSERDYLARVRKVRSYLAGEDSAPIRELESAIASAVAQLNFEKAQSLHLQLGEIKWVLEHLGRLRIAKGEYLFVYPYLGVWYLIRGGIVIDAVPTPRDHPSALKASAAIDRVFRQAPETGRKGDIRDLDMLLLVSSWFRQFPQHLAKTLSVAEAEARLERLLRPQRATVAMKRPKTRKPSVQTAPSAFRTAKTA